MRALRYFCGFSLQIVPYAFFCIYPFRNHFRYKQEKAILTLLSIFTVTVIPFSLIGQFNLGGNYYREFFSNLIFYIALLLFGVMYSFTIRAKIAEKLFVFFLVMSYGFFVTSSVTFLYRTFKFKSDSFMYPPISLALTFFINLVLAKPILMLMERIRIMIDVDLKTRIWQIFCLLPAMFILIASIAQFSTTLHFDKNAIVHAMFVLFALFAFSVYAIFFGVMGYICRNQEELLLADRMLESYRNQAENNEHIRKVHHEIRHHLNALSAYLKQEDYTGAQQYIQEFAHDAEHLPFVTYTDNTLVNSILSEFSGRAKSCKTKTEYNIIIGNTLDMEDIDLCRMLTNILENAIESCEKIPEERRFIRLTLHSKGNFLFVKCENACDENNLKASNGIYKSSKKEIRKHGYGLKIISEIAEKYNGILSVQAHNGIFTVTTNLCLDKKTKE